MFTIFDFHKNYLPKKCKIKCSFKKMNNFFLFVFFISLAVLILNILLLPAFIVRVYFLLQIKISLFGRRPCGGQQEFWPQVVEVEDPILRLILRERVYFICSYLKFSQVILAPRQKNSKGSTGKINFITRQSLNGSHKCYAKLTHPKRIFVQIPSAVLLLQLFCCKDVSGRYQVLWYSLDLYQA